MNRNTEAHFSSLPHARVSRSRFDRSSTHKTTFNSGRLIPIFVDEVLPGDTFELSTSFVIRMSTPVFPVMDNCYIDFYYFYVPSRLIWNHWEEFNGENKVGPWKQTVEYTIPSVQWHPSFKNSKPPVGSVGDYFGIPQGPIGYTSSSGEIFQGASPSVLPLRAYSLIWNDWFRDENLQYPINVHKEQFVNSEWMNNTTTTSPGNPIPFNPEYGYCSEPAPVCKYHDYFTSALPSPQKGDPVSLPLALPDSETFFPVYTGADNPFLSATRDPFKVYSMEGAKTGIRYLAADMNDDGVGKFTHVQTVGTDGMWSPANLHADLTGLQLNAVTINSLRQAFQLQKLYEKDARGGTRYIEILKSHFGVTSGDARLQRPEYLGGKRVPINVSQVLQTSSTDETSPQGNTAAYSLTTDTSASFTRSFVEHGYIIGLCCVRNDHTYQQGLEKFWSRKTRFDFYWPVFANIGEQPIFNREIYVAGAASDSEVFGYQEAWADYRYKPSRTSALFRSGVNGSLDSWHYGDYYSVLPVLGPAWIEENDKAINRTLAVPSKGSQDPSEFLADFYFKLKCTRPMPLYSIPGLVDHH